MKTIFVSYSRRNKTFAERIARDLSDAGLEVWVDFRQIQGGELWQNEIYRGIARAEIVVFCLSPDSVISEWCRREVLTARGQGKTIIPVMAVNAFDTLKNQVDMTWMLDVHILNFEGRYEAAFPELLEALPGARGVGVYDDVPVDKIPNPFKGLEAFQQTDSHFFFGREGLVNKSLKRLREDQRTRFLAVVGASGSGKSSLVRAGIIPRIRAGEMPTSDQWPLVIFTPGANPIEALATRLLPLLADDRPLAVVTELLQQNEDQLSALVQGILQGTPDTVRMLLVVDQFEEVFTRASDAERENFLKLLHHAVTVAGGRTQIVITMRADFFGNLSRYPALAELFEQENMIIATEMTTANLLRSIEGPAQAVGLVYDDGLTDRILEDVRRQPGSLPLLQYALKELYERRDGRRLTLAAYEAIGGVQRALAQHAEDIYSELNAPQQAIMRRLLLRLVEVNPNGEITRRRGNRAELTFKDVQDEAVQEVIELLTAAQSRLLIASREIRPSEDERSEPVTWIDVSHEALIREWERFKGWVAENVEGLRYGSELMKMANDWARGGRDVAYLLTGNRLMRAEVWLETADASPLQREFIQASIEERKRREAALLEQQARELQLQRRAANRLRYFVAVLVISLVVAIVLTLAALGSEGRAVNAANAAGTSAAVADRNADEANSLALAASADRFFADGNTELALALAVESAQIADPPPQAQFSLATVAYAPGIRLRMSGHTGAVNAVAFSPDGRVALSAGSDNALILWDLRRGEVIRRLEGHTAAVNGAAFSPDGTTAVSSAEDGTLILWDINAGTVLRQLGGGAYGHSGSVLAVAFSSDGRYVLSGGADFSLILWDVETGMALRQFTGHTDAVTAVAFSPDGSLALSGAKDRAVMLWNVATGVAVRTFGDAEHSHSGAVLAVAFSPDGTTATSGSADDSVILWDLSGTGNGAFIRQFTTTVGTEQTGGGDVFALAYSPDGRTVAAGTEEGRIIFWNAVTGEVGLRFSPGSGVLSGAHTGNVRTLAYSPDGRSVLSGGADNLVILWDVRRAEEIRSSETPGGGVLTLAYSPDGRFVLAGSFVSTENPVGDLRLWNADNGKTIQQYVGHASRVNSAVFSPDGGMIASGDNNGALILWDAGTGQEIRRFGVDGLAHTDAIYAVTFTPDGSQVFSASRDTTIRAWDVQTGDAVGDALTGHGGSIFALAVSPDGKLLASGSLDREVIVWDVVTRQEVHRLTGHTRSVRSLAFGPDSQMLVSGGTDGSMILWDAVGGDEIKRFSGHRTVINGLAFSPDGRAVISGALDGTLRLWDIASAFEIRRYQASGVGVQSLAFSPDGLTLASGMTDRTLRIWRVLPTVKQLLDWTFANRFVPELECTQRTQFNLELTCDEDQIAPTRTAYPLPTVTPTTDVGRLVIGGTATVNTTTGDKLNLRATPGLNGRVILSLDSGVQVTLLDGPLTVDQLAWWKVRTPDGQEGWVVESTNNIQTLLP